MTRLYLVRHGETDWNLARRIQGSTDIPLNDTGRAQARRTGQLLAARQLDGLYSSPLSRARETAEIVSGIARLGEPVIVDAVTERRYGAAEGLDYRTLDRRFPEGTPVPGRERRRQVAQRVLPALMAIARQREGEDVVVVTHGGVIRSVVMAVASEPSEFRGVPIANGSFHSFVFADDAFELVAFDDAIQTASVPPGADDFADQNAVAARESR